MTPPWQQVITTQEYVDAANAPTRNVSSRVVMIDNGDTVVATLPVTGGTVSCDPTKDERWAASVTLDNTDLMPSRVEDILHPLSGLRARIYWSLELPSTVAEIPVGTYYVSNPSAGNTSDEGGTLSVRLLDIVSRIRRNKWGTGQVIDLGGMTVTAALQRVLGDRAPNVALVLTETTATLPTVYEVGEAGRDPWVDVVAIAEAGAFVVYSDRYGAIVAEPRNNNPTGVSRLTYRVGPDNRMESIDRDISEADLLNMVTVRSTSTEVDPPVYATVQDNDPASPLWVGHGFIYSEVIDSDSVTTEAACRDLATATLAQRRALIESVDLVHRARPEVDPLDLMDIDDPTTGASGTYQLSAWSIGLEPGAMQRSTATDRRINV